MGMYKRIHSRQDLESYFSFNESKGFGKLWANSSQSKKDCR